MSLLHNTGNLPRRTAGRRVSRGAVVSGARPGCRPDPCVSGGGLWQGVLAVRDRGVLAVRDRGVLAVRDRGVLAVRDRIDRLSDSGMAALAGVAAFAAVGPRPAAGRPLRPARLDPGPVGPGSRGADGGRVRRQASRPSGVRAGRRPDCRPDDRGPRRRRRRGNDRRGRSPRGSGAPPAST